LQDQAWLQETTARIIRTRTHVLQELAAMGLHVPPSRANFVFPRLPEGRAAEIFAALEQRRILVRYFQGALVNQSFRVTIGTDADMEMFLKELRALLA
jgi:histidinol-phosphate aminotransferase